MTALSELIGRLDALTGPDRQADGLIFGWLHNTEPCGTFMCGFDEEKFQFRHPDGPKEGRHRAWYVKGVDLPTYTASLDAAVALVERKLPGWRIEMRIGDWPAHDQRRVTLWNNDITKRENVFGISADAATPAIALCIALLRALEQSNDEVGRT